MLIIVAQVAHKQRAGISPFTERAFMGLVLLPARWDRVVQAGRLVAGAVAAAAADIMAVAVVAVVVVVVALPIMAEQV